MAFVKKSKKCPKGMTKKVIIRKGRKSYICRRPGGRSRS